MPITDGRGTRGEAEILRWHRDAVELALRDRSSVARPERRFWLATRAVGARFDWLLEKAVELGAWGILPLAASRGDGRSRRARWERLIRAAAEQCMTAWVPTVADPAPLDEILNPQEEHRWRAILVADAGGRPAGEVPAARLPAGDLLLLVGPPEGLSPSRRADLEARAEVIFLALGARRLRSETAALAALVWATALAGPQDSTPRP